MSLFNKPVLQAKRRNGCNFVPQKINTEDTSDLKRALKRTFNDPCLQKYSANDRLKRLRTQLTQDMCTKELNSIASSSKTIFKPDLYTSPLINAQNLKRLCNSDICDQSVKKNKTFTEMVNSMPKPESAFFTFTFRVNEHKTDVTNQETTSFLPENVPVFEEMDWTTQFQGEETSLQASKEEKIPDSSEKKENDDLFIIVDTNIFISNLTLIKNIINMPIKGSCKPIIYIPWIVFEELDDFKGDPLRCSQKRNAQIAIKYINDLLNEKNERIKGQSMDDFNSQKDTDMSHDNKIIACCLQIEEKYSNVILLSNDINLRNKALINRIKTCSDHEIMRKISTILNKYQKILNSMTYLCKDVIAKCTYEAYGSIWKHMNKSRLNTLQDCLDLLKKYWKSVFQTFLLKQSSKAICDLSDFMKDKDLCDELEILNELVRLCVRLCLYFKDVKECKEKVEKTIRYINQIKDS